MQSTIGRREFIGVSLAFAASVRGAEPQANFPTEPRQRLAVSSYPFRSVINSAHGEDRDTTKPGMSLAQFAEMVMTKLQVPGIEPWSRHFDSTDSSYVRDLGRSFQKAGVRVVNIPVDANVHLCGSGPEARKAGLDTYHKWVDAAVILGSPGIRVHVPGTDTSCASDALKELASYGAQKNIVINLENDEPRTEDPFRIVKIIESVNSPFLRALPDFCNSMLIKDDAEYNYRAMQAMFPHAFNISHVKDMESENGKVYRVDVDRIFAIAKQAGYRGYFSMEWEGTGDPYEGTRRLLEQSLKDLA